MEEKKRILKMVKEGKLTVEEALALLEQLDEQKSGSELFGPLHSSSLIRIRSSTL